MFTGLKESLCENDIKCMYKQRQEIYCVLCIRIIFHERDATSMNN